MLQNPLSVKQSGPCCAVARLPQKCAQPGTFVAKTVESSATAGAKKVEWVPLGSMCQVRNSQPARCLNCTHRVNTFHWVALDSCRGSQWRGGASRQIKAWDWNCQRHTWTKSTTTKLNEPFKTKCKRATHHLWNLIELNAFFVGVLSEWWNSECNSLRTEYKMNRILRHFTSTAVQAQSGNKLWRFWWIPMSGSMLQRFRGHYGGDRLAAEAIRRCRQRPAHRPLTTWRRWSNESLACWAPAPLLLPRVKAALAGRRPTLNYQLRGGEDGRWHRGHSRSTRPQLSANPWAAFSQVAKGSFDARQHVLPRGSDFFFLIQTVIGVERCCLPAAWRPGVTKQHRCSTCSVCSCFGVHTGEPRKSRCLCPSAHCVWNSRNDHKTVWI